MKNIIRIMLIFSLTAICIVTHADKTKLANHNFLGPFKVDKEGFVRDWLIIGPFPNLGNREKGCEGWTTDFLKSYGGEKDFIACQGLVTETTFKECEYWAGGKAKLAWKVHKAKKYFINLGPFMLYEPLDIVFAPAQYVAGYAFCVIKSDKKQEVTVAIGADDDYQLWLDHQYIGGQARFGACRKDMFKHKVTLKQGLTPVLLKCGTDISGHRFCLRFLGADGKPVMDIEVLLPEKKK